MAPDRVVVINDSSLARGGATGLALLSVQMLAQCGQRVQFICGDAAGEVAGAEDVLSLGRARLREGAALSALRRGVYDAEARDMVAGWIERNDNPGTVYHLHGWAQILSPAVLDALAPVAARTLLHAHDMFLACPNGAYMDYVDDRPCERVPMSVRCITTNCDRRSYPQKLWRVARQRQLRKALDWERRPWGGVAMIHPAMREMLERGGVPGDKLFTQRNPASAWCAERVQAEANDGLLYVGRLRGEKGVVELARAARQAGMPLTAIGEGPQGDILAREFPEVARPGWLDAAGIAEHARRARGLVMPSLTREPFGLVAAEASASGLPVILPTTALMSGEVNALSLGFSYNGSDPQGLAGALQRLRDLAADETRAMSERAFSRRTPLAATPEAWIDGLLATYERLIAGH
ncbi:glycosyltransferase involved in cell wall biosynthesis [Aliiruegeria haliotis]|uniref:Glycosyltransferase involved in cell wall biosynthesis n=1 Tax=Aliiruegeria haliotis TaxID=1280846 RepID=A0A2T0RVD4_9RHOB|nr:glycosyltransferase [Aliiruegeria haliotis]PRY25155.1 glycosyltransferase involved in cell wall biosynthesis [Aliiruegeria haliotis]